MTSAVALVNGLLWLLGCQLAGEAVVALTGLPVPAPVVGMLALLALLVWREPQPVVRVADALLRHLQLFFVPAGLGVVALLGLLREQALPVALGMLGSWLLGLLAVAGCATALAHLRRGRA